MNHTARNRARRGLLAGACLLATAASVAGGGPRTSAALYTDAAAAALTTTAITVPAVDLGPAQVDGTNAVVHTRVPATCADPAGVQYRWRDQVTSWGATWNSWSSWAAPTDPGYTGWSASTLDWVGVPCQVQWEIRCGVVTWTSTTSTTNVPIERTA